jgi:hypothetical protein
MVFLKKTHNESSVNRDEKKKRADVLIREVQSKKGKTELEYQSITEPFFRDVKIWSIEISDEGKKRIDFYITHHPDGKLIKEFVNKEINELAHYPPPRNYWGSPILDRNYKIRIFKPGNAERNLMKAIYDYSELKVVVTYFGDIFMMNDKVRHRISGEIGIVKAIYMLQETKEVFEVLKVKSDKYIICWKSFDVSLIAGGVRVYD